MKNQEKINFEKELNELNLILDKMSMDTTRIDESLELYKIGVSKIKELEKYLKDTEKEVEKVIEIEQ